MLCKVKRYSVLVVLGVMILVLSLQFSMAAAEFQVVGFSCAPDGEVSVGNSFSCTAQIQNVGDASGSVNIATLYPDSNDWLENSNYVQSSGTSVGVGQSTEVTFSGLRAVKSGINGYSKIMLDQVTDTYVADYDMNVIDVIVSVDNSASSAVMGDTFDAEAEITAGGNIDVTLTWTAVSGGCSIENQDSQKTITGMTNGNKQSRTWTVTQGTSGSCVFRITAAAEGANGLAFTSDLTQSTITCTDCPSDGGTSSSGGGGSSGGGSVNETEISEGTSEIEDVLDKGITSDDEGYLSKIKKSNAFLFWFFGIILIVVIAFYIIKSKK